MGSVKVDIHKTAKIPYEIETTGIRLYSIEELAYYLYENIYLAEERIIGEKLYQWLECEADMETLAKRLRSEKLPVYEQVFMILRASEYYSETELEEIREKIRALSGMQTQERMKYKADEFLQNENYWAAIKEYDRILEIRQNSRLDVKFYGEIWEHLGICYGNLFLFEKAAACFENAYEFQRSQAYKEKAFYARKLAHYGQEETEYLSETKLSEEFLQQGEQILEELRIKSRKSCENLDAEAYIKAQEEKYRKISCN